MEPLPPLPPRSSRPIAAHSRQIDPFYARGFLLMTRNKRRAYISGVCARAPRVRRVRRPPSVVSQPPASVRWDRPAPPSPASSASPVAALGRPATAAERERKRLAAEERRLRRVLEGLQEIGLDRRKSENGSHVLLLFYQNPSVSDERRNVQRVVKRTQVVYVLAPFGSERRSEHISPVVSPRSP